MSSGAPLVSVYIPCHNYGRYLADAVESVRRQTLTDWELFVVDDGSSDESASVADGYRDVSGITVLRNDSPLGLRSVANQCIKRARGRWLLRLDADDLLHTNALEILVKEAGDDPGTGIVFPDYYYMGEDGSVTGVECLPSFDGEYQATSFPPHGAGSLVRLDLLRELGGFDESLRSQDGHELWLRLLASGASTRHVALPLFYYRQHRRSLSRDLDGVLADRAELKRRLTAELPGQRRIVGILTICNTNPEFPDIPFLPFDGSCLLDRAVEEAVLVDELECVVVSTDCPRVHAHVQERHPAARAILRAPELRGHDVDIRLVLGEVARLLELGDDDLLCVLNLHTPFRRATHIRHAIDNYALFELDSVVTVYEERDLVYQLGAEGLEPVNPSRQYRLRREREAVYIDNAAVRLFPVANLEIRRFLGERIGHVLMSRAEGFKINTREDMQRLIALVDRDEAPAGAPR